MNSILKFLSNNYKWFLIAAGVLLIALIGFIADSRKKKKASTDVPSVNQNVGPVPTPTPTVDQTTVQPNVNVAPVAPNMEAPSMEAPSVTVSNESMQMPPSPDVIPASSMTFNDMPTPSLNENLTETTISTDEVKEPIQNNEFNQEPTVAVPSLEETPVETPSIVMPTFEVPSTAAPDAQMNAVEMPQIETPVVNEVPQSVIMPEPMQVEPTVLTQPTSVPEPVPTIITPSTSQPAAQPVNVVNQAPVDLNQNNNGQI